MKPPKKAGKTGNNDGKDKKTAPHIATDAPDDKRAARNVAKIRQRLATAMDDPAMRDQIVRAMRSLIYEDEK